MVGTHADAVDEEFMHAQSCYVGHGALHTPFQLKFLAQIAGSQSGVHAFSFARLQFFQPYPTTAPPVFTEQSDGKPLYGTPFGLPPVGGHPHPPVGLVATLQGASAVVDP